MDWWDPPKFSWEDKPNRGIVPQDVRLALFGVNIKQDLVHIEKIGSNINKHEPKNNSCWGIQRNEIQMQTERHKNAL